MFPLFSILERGGKRVETADLSTTLRSTGFPVELDGVGALHAAFLNESSTRGHVQRCVAGNPGPVEMTNLFEGDACIFLDTRNSASYRLVISTGGVIGLRPTQGDENASVQQPLSMEPLSFPLSSRANPDFLLHSSQQRPLMWFSLKRTTCT
jgi:hypothetical protein